MTFLVFATTLLVFARVVVANTIIFSEDIGLKGLRGTRSTTTDYCKSLDDYSTLGCLDAFAYLSYLNDTADNRFSAVGGDLSDVVTSRSGVRLASNFSILVDSGVEVSLDTAGVVSGRWWSGSSTHSCLQWTSTSKCRKGECGVPTVTGVRWTGGFRSNCNEALRILCVCLNGTTVGTPAPTTTSPTGSPTTTEPTPSPTKFPTGPPTNAPTPSPTQFPTTKFPSFSPTLPAGYLVLFSCGVVQGSSFGIKATADAACASCEGSMGLSLTKIAAFASFDASNEIRDLPTLNSYSTSVPIVSATGTLLADDWADLMDGSVKTSLHSSGIFDSFSITESYFVWTGSIVGGSVNLNCNGWVSGSPQTGNVVLAASSKILDAASAYVNCAEEAYRLCIGELVDATKQPTTSPTLPTNAPTKSPTKAPTPAPTKSPTTSSPTTSPTPPTNSPTLSPTKSPTPPTSAPTTSPTASPSFSPTASPTPPTFTPTTSPTLSPVPPTSAPTTATPTSSPTTSPTPPTSSPSSSPSFSIGTVVMFGGAGDFGYEFGPKSYSDAQCESYASSMGLPLGNIATFASFDAENTISSLDYSGEVLSPTGVLLGTTWADVIDGTISATLSSAGVFGSPDPSGTNAFWSGSIAGGDLDLTCSAWTTPSPARGNYGTTTHTTFLFNADLGCDSLLLRVCVGEVVQVTNSPTTSPTPLSSSPTLSPTLSPTTPWPTSSPDLYQEIILFSMYTTQTGQIGNRALTTSNCKAHATTLNLDCAGTKLLISYGTLDRMNRLFISYYGVFGPTGIRIANAFGDLFDGSILVSLADAEVYVPGTAPDYWWTGSDTDGTVRDTCSGFVSGSGTGTRGLMTATDSTWITAVDGTCAGDAIDKAQICACERLPPIRHQLYSDDQTYNGSIAIGGGRSVVDAWCGEIAVAQSLVCASTHLLVSFSSTDQIVDMPTNFGFDADIPITGPTGIRAAENWNGLSTKSFVRDLRDAEVVSNVLNFWTGTKNTGEYSGTSCSGWTDGTSGSNGRLSDDVSSLSGLDLSCALERKYVCLCTGPATSTPTKSPTTSTPSTSPSKSPTTSPSTSPTTSPSSTPTSSPTLTPYYVFLTTTTLRGDFGNAAASTACSTSATARGVACSAVAPMLATSTPTSSTSFVDEVPSSAGVYYVSLDGTTVATSESLLINGPLLSTLSAAGMSCSRFWTGSTTTGGLGERCLSGSTSWASTTATGVYGSCSTTATTWNAAGTASCSSEYPILCACTPTPTTAPTTSPTDSPTASPTPPTSSPTTSPSTSPTVSPTPPTSAPSTSPTASPTVAHVIYALDAAEDGTIGGWSNKHTACGTKATSLGLTCPSGAYPLISTSTSNDMATQLPSEGRFVTPDGTLLAESKTQLLSGTLTNDLETGGIACSGGTHWTGVDSDGVHDDVDCSNWSTNSGASSGTFGDCSSTSNDWKSAGPGGCDVERSILCVCRK